MKQAILKELAMRVEHIPAHGYIGIWDLDADGYGEFWEKHDCDAVCGIIDSMAPDSHPLGYEWNEEACQDYQRHNPEILGYQVLRPVKRK